MAFDAIRLLRVASNGSDLCFDVHVDELAATLDLLAAKALTKTM